MRLVPQPTPLHPAPRLSSALGTEVWLKRDDLTGLGLGGNKVRALEYLLGDATMQRADCLVTAGGPQSNWLMLAALAARRCGMDAYLVLYGEPVEPGGNLMLAALAGADVRFSGRRERESAEEAAGALAAELRGHGRTPYLLPRGGATAVGAVGYVRAAFELAAQLDESGLVPRQLWLATGSCGTQAGLVAGAWWLRMPCDVIGVTVSRPADECLRRISQLADGVIALLGLPAAGGGRPIDVRDGFFGPGYGRRSPEGERAARLVAATEGVFLDPIFGAKAMAALISAAQQGQAEGPVVFLVTGGAPTLFVPGGSHE